MEEKKLTKKELRCLQYFADGETHSPLNRDIESFFELATMGLLEEYFDGCLNDNVGYITDKGLAALQTIRSGSEEGERGL